MNVKGVLGEPLSDGTVRLHVRTGVIRCHSLTSMWQKKEEPVGDIAAPTTPENRPSPLSTPDEEQVWRCKFLAAVDRCMKDFSFLPHDLWQRNLRVYGDLHRLNTAVRFDMSLKKCDAEETLRTLRARMYSEDYYPL